MRKTLPTHQATILLSLTVSVLAFQNCSPVNFATTPSIAPGSGVDAFGGARVSINDGATFTNDVAVNLQLTAREAEEMFVTNDTGCTSGGAWEKYNAKRPWNLKESNSSSSVYAKFKRIDKKTDMVVESPCVDAAIIHDGKAPSVKFESGPAPHTQSQLAEFNVRGDDELSGIDYFECRLNAEGFKKCFEIFNYTNVIEGRHKVEVRAVDKADNRSLPVDYAWDVDRTKPVVRILDPKPVLLSTSPNAVFHFEANDSGSGIDKIFCSLNGSQPAACTSPLTRANLPDGNYVFRVHAVDLAGNVSNTQSHTWSISTTPSGEFEVLGITGNLDQDVDTFLGTTLVPTIHWSVSMGAVSYHPSIHSATGMLLCDGTAVSAQMFSFPSSCGLTDGVRYRARVVARAENGLTRQTSDFNFRVDNSGPTIVIQPVVTAEDQKSATINFSITDNNSGVHSASCFKSHNTGPAQQMNCKDLTNVAYNNLSYGDHFFRIEARDNASNRTVSSTIKFVTQQIICDPFSNQEEPCKKGLKGEIFYQTEAQVQQEGGWRRLSDFFAKGTRISAILYMSNIHVPTRLFTSGFPTSENDRIRDSQGNILFEWFAMRLESVFKLAPTDTAGLYEFATLSDDGTILSIKRTPTGAFEPLVSNDSHHSTMLGCGNARIQVDSSTRMPIKLEYFQGPRERIAVSVLFRPVTEATPAEPLCGNADNEFYGPVGNQDHTSTKYGALLSRGWKPLAHENFILQENQ